MSPASYLTAPPRVAVGMIAPPLSLTILALIVGTLAALAGLAYAIAEGFQLWHDAKLFLRAFGRTMDDLTHRVDRLAAHEPADFGRLEASVARLQRSAARLSVLLNALGRVQEQFVGVRAVYPRK
jgi:hypothetical protein